MLDEAADPSNCPASDKPIDPDGVAIRQHAEAAESASRSVDTRSSDNTDPLAVDWAQREPFPLVLRFGLNRVGDSRPQEPGGGPPHCPANQQGLSRVESGLLALRYLFLGISPCS
jgi:hypothetical protein